MAFLRLGGVAIGPGAATLVGARKRRIRYNGIPVPWIADVDELARVTINGNEMPAAAVPGDAQAKRAALIDLGLDVGQRDLAAGDRVEIADNLQGQIEEPRLIALRRAAIIATRRLAQRRVGDRALGLTARGIGGFLAGMFHFSEVELTPLERSAGRACSPRDSLQFCYRKNPSARNEDLETPSGLQKNAPCGGILLRQREATILAERLTLRRKYPEAAPAGLGRSPVRLCPLPYPTPAHGSMAVLGEPAD